VRLNSLRNRFALALLAAAAAGGLLLMGLMRWLPASGWPRGLAILAVAVLIVALVLWLSTRVLAPLRRLVRSLEGAVLSYRDGDFSVSLAATRDDELGDLVSQHNAMPCASSASIWRSASCCSTPWCRTPPSRSC
jgi:two-component system nitrogen regulation sensor histidine kinase NtrY